MATTLDTPLIAYPTLSQAANLLGVSPSTLSRRQDVALESMGERDKRVPVAEVLRLAAIFRRRAINEVAADLIDYARERAPTQASSVEGDVEHFFEQLEAPTVRERDFLAEAKRALPRELYREVERAYRDGAGRRPTSIVAME